MRLVAATMAAGIYLTLVWASPVSAHAEPVDSNPAACTTVSTADHLTVVFGEELAIEGSSVTALSKGTVLATAGLDLADLDHKSINVTLPAGITGVVTVEWASRSASDSDGDAGSYQFAIGENAFMSNCGLDSGQGESGPSFPYLMVGISAVAIAGLAMVRRKVGSDV